MNKRLFFLSVFMIVPGIVKAAETSYEFPNPAENEYMQPNHIYKNAAKFENIGKYSGSLIADAKYGYIDYTVGVGKYLPADDIVLKDCEPNSFCPGISGTVNYDMNNNQGITSCSSQGNGTYIYSASGSMAPQQCYKNCTKDNANIEHATNVSGNDYYDDDANDTCSATSCENGWSVAVVSLADKIGETQTDILQSVSGTGIVFGTKLGLESTQRNSFAASFKNDKGAIRGYGRCSTFAGDNNNNSWSNPTSVDLIVDETGNSGAQHCYCKVVNYTTSSGISQNVSTKWVYVGDLSNAVTCSSQCSLSCSQGITVPNFREALFAAQTEAATCVANTISISWPGASETDISANNAGQCTYGEDIRTPVAATSPITGKRIVGWRVKKVN